jgi:cytochrome c oxidase subunit I
LRLKQRPYNLLLLTAVLLFVAELISINSALAIGLHDTYYTFPLTYFIWTPTFLLVLFWFLYVATKHFLFSKALVWAHIVLTIITSVYILALPFLLSKTFEGLAGMPRRYYDIGQTKTFTFFVYFAKSAILLAFVLALGQLTYLVNLGVGLYRRINNQNNR